MSSRCCLCLVSEREVADFLEPFQKEHPISIMPSHGTLEIQSDVFVIEKVRERFKTFCYGEGLIEEAVHLEFTLRQKTLSIAESCTGGMIASKITLLAGASNYFLGSIVAYSDPWKERFLQMSRTTLKNQGAVSKEVVIEMVRGLLEGTEADYAVAISGLAGTGDGKMYIAIGQRGEAIDAGVVYSPKERAQAIHFGANLALGALWRRIVHNIKSFTDERISATR